MADLFDPRRTALVLIDLIDRIVDQPLQPRPGREVVATAESLATAFREHGAPVVLVRVERPNVAEQPPGSGLVAGLLQDGDVEIVKRTIGGFQGTGLDDRLRERNVETLVFAGIATNLGVESTARAALDHGYRLIFVEDAMTAFTAEEHQAAVELDFPRLGTVIAAADLGFTG
ncbi:isochorismatase family protein [Microlunatus parietis]|uniref:Nicotinamidase-related amidase n=1 Tax=Microlunatus parietis TaxID=682979 RepID=A0A7Y9I885_9ACTN|nr:isochorismatase family protein [Microlunatus parietis]NYE71796.1 nicotinamidase-related amidase [Microlunatus parietis]